MNQQETLEKLKCLLIDEGFQLHDDPPKVFSIDQYIYFKEFFAVYNDNEKVIKIGILGKHSISDYPLEAIQQGNIQPIIDWLALWGVRTG